MGSVMMSDKRICKWCEKEIEGKGWKDGPNIYCNFRCFSAKNCWPMLGIALFLTPIIGLLATPWMQEVFIEDWIFLGPIWSSVAYYGFLGIAGLTVLWFYYTVYLGWRVRKSKTESFDSSFPTEEFRTYDS